MIAQAKYIKINLKIEHISKVLNFLLIKLTTAGVIMPNIIITIVSYFLFDLGEDSFYSAAPTMYVRNYGKMFDFLI